MSDPNTTPNGEPVAEEAGVDEAVARANEGLAEAEIAGREAVGEPVVLEETVVEDAVIVDPETPVGAAEPETVVVEEESVAWYDRPLEETPGAAEPESAVVVEDAAAEPVAESVVQPEAPVAPADTVPAAEETFVATQSGQPIFVQAPEPPRPRGNRGAAGLIGLLAAVAFGVLYLAVILGAAFAFGFLSGDTAVEYIVGTVTSWLFWTPIVAFFLGFWLLGAILNRARWAHWVIWGIVVGVITYGGYLLGALLQAPFWQLTAREGEELLSSQALAPYAIVAFVLGREMTIWFGAWVASRGRHVTELNEVAQREYERTLEAGPQLQQR